MATSKAGALKEEKFARSCSFLPLSVDVIISFHAQFDCFLQQATWEVQTRSRARLLIVTTHFRLGNSVTLHRAQAHAAHTHLLAVGHVLHQPHHIPLVNLSHRCRALRYWGSHFNFMTSVMKICSFNPNLTFLFLFLGHIPLFFSFSFAEGMVVVWFVFHFLCSFPF